MKKLIFIMIIIIAVFSIAKAQYAAPYAGDHTFWMVSGNLTSDGTQYSTEISTTTADVAVTAFQNTIDIHIGDYGSAYFEKTIEDCYFKTLVEIKADSSASAKVSWKVQAKDLNEDDWVDLSAWSDGSSAIGTTYVEKELTGWVDLSDSDFGRLPFEYRILVKCDEAGEGRIKIKSGSYIRVVYLIW